MKEYITYEDAIDVVKRILEMYDNKISELLKSDNIDEELIIHYSKQQSSVYMTLNDLESRIK